MNGATRRGERQEEQPYRRGRFFCTKNCMFPNVMATRSSDEQPKYCDACLATPCSAAAMPPMSHGLLSQNIEFLAMTFASWSTSRMPRIPPKPVSLACSRARSSRRVVMTRWSRAGGASCGAGDIVDDCIAIL